MVEPYPRYKYGPGIFPLRSFHARLSRRQFNAFAQQMSRFAMAFHFNDLSRQATPDPNDVFFYMERNELNLIGGTVPPMGETDLIYQIGFYPRHDRAPPPPENVDGLVEGLKTFLAPVEGIVLTEMAASRK